MDTVTAIDIVRDSLRDNLTDAYVTAGGAYRGGSLWIFSDEPTSVAKYPMIQLKKVDNPSEVMDIGYEYTEFEQLYINIWFHCKNGFKVTISGTEYKNAKLAEYYLGLIKSTLKTDASNLHTDGTKGYKHVNTSTVEYDPETQLYYGTVTVRVFYFNT